MKRLLAALLAALLLLTLAACQKTQDPGPEEPDEPVIGEPDTPEETPEEPEDTQEPEEPDGTTDEPEDTQEPETNPDIPEGGAMVLAAGGDGYAGEGTQVAYDIYVPKVETGNEQVDQIINDYYANQEKKLLDQAAGELVERAADEGRELTVLSNFNVERNGDGILSIYRNVIVREVDTGLEDITAYAETFDLTSGGLMTADAFFDTDEATYTQRLVDCVRRQIREDPYHDQNYFAQWEDAAQRQFNRDQFYVTEDGYTVFYQQHSLGYEIHCYEIPWSQLADILA